jgi:hypothetical protein
MVRGLAQFREQFRSHAGQYVLIGGQRDELIKRDESQLNQTHAVETTFLFRWRLA